MIAFISTFLFDPIKRWLALGLVVLTIVGGIFLKGKKSGVNKERRRNKKELQKNVAVKEKIHNDIANDSTSGLDKRLRRWSKN